MFATVLKTSLLRLNFSNLMIPGVFHILLFGDASNISCHPVTWNKVPLEEEGVRGVISPTGGLGLAPEKIFKLQTLVGDFLSILEKKLNI